MLLHDPVLTFSSWMDWMDDSKVLWYIERFMVNSMTARSQIPLAIN